MSGIQPIAVTEILNFVSNSIKGAKVTVNGVEKEFPIWKTKFAKDTVRKYVKLGTEERGLITKAALVDVQGREWAVENYDYEKGQDGFILAFPFTQMIVTKEPEVFE